MRRVSLSACESSVKVSPIAKGSAWSGTIAKIVHVSTTCQPRFSMGRLESKFAQARGYRHLRCAPSREDAADEGENQRVDQTLNHDCRRHSEGEGDLAECREVHRRGAHAVEREIGN